MIRRNLTYAAIMAACFGGPYSYYSPEARETVQSLWNQASAYIPSGAKSESGDKPAVSIEAKPQLDTPPPDQPNPFITPSLTGSDAANLPVAGPPVQDFLEVFNFNVDSRWVTMRWPRVSTTLADLNLEGLRAPLVTGSQYDDLAGSITYYFDRDGHVQRITFQGSTGDERRLVGMLTQHFGFKHEPTLDAGLYLVKWNGDPTSVLMLRSANVVSASQPHARLSVSLEINRPSRYYGLSPHMAAAVEEAKSAQRWGQP
ncbi:DUF6690 family protein [Blastopirellula marina]|uniref:DUF6690 domain-containing protein n=1 Tax=Blastopirellula marina TaxID=124 RepID=A0A2S8GFU3_9BACT|nr:DUF6690 family protein [Blastopirellula marina]PQO43347.1 hypothetical protein C5Y98_00080 [Blastopirellula marina]PTL46661.1 hypothetical protein C5Y97_00080 [Blastopirellula marina]